MNELLKRVMAVVSRCLFFVVLFSVAQAVDTPVDVNKIDEGYLVELPNKKDSDILAIYTLTDEPKKTDGNVMASSTDEFGYHPITYDTAYVNITNNLDEGIHVWGNSDECYKCKLRYLGDVHQMSTKVLYMDTRWKLQIAIYSKDDTIQYCRLYYHFGEEGRYTYFVNRNTSTSSGVECTKPITINREPQDANIPIYIALAVYGGFALVYIFIAAGIRDGWFDKILCCFSTDHLVTNELGSPETASHVPPASDRNSINRQQPSKPKRLKSLDTFRGISIVLMILVNYGGGKYWFLVHARWNGKLFTRPHWMTLFQTINP
ncbi:heparan-alpha-glucosaminide N-acetyltransferase-like [Amphiura filiformis]|uniref:heparan-alpha-glucosaminide N-acetyltransferase-like n=1 Tax=Amphiura filiformis TaxID=82378 RepID=UPI003B20F1F3